ncbi:MAG: PD40 domain-containing protein [Bacteroidales bacterium]|nr:PD40 domain-containing protein [Bacteroidales bacterium]
MNRINTTILFLAVIVTICSCEKDKEVNRNDSAVKLELDLSGSIQNPAFSPDGKTIVFTLFRNGYNKPPSDLYTFNLETNILRLLVADGNSNVNLPGQSWNESLNSIIFSSDREPHDEIYYIAENGTTGDEIRITNRTDSVAYEPTFSPDGLWIVFESHKLEEEENGVITKYKLDGTSGYINLTPLGEDCKQPNWSPMGDKILYQKEENKQWDIWVMNIDGSNKTMITNFEGSKTDAVFSADGQYIIFSAENSETEFANIYTVSISNGSPIQLTNYSGYDGAPSISPNGTKLIFETSSEDPDKSDGTSLWLLDLRNE